MNMIEVTREFSVDDMTAADMEDRFDALSEALVDAEDSRPRLLDSSVFIDVERKIIGVTVTVKITGTEGEAGIHAFRIVDDAIRSIGDNVTGDAPMIRKDAHEPVAVAV